MAEINNNRIYKIQTIQITDNSKDKKSTITKEKYSPATTTPVSRSGYPPWVLKCAELKSSGFNK